MEKIKQKIYVTPRKQSKVRKQFRVANVHQTKGKVLEETVKFKSFNFKQYSESKIGNLANEKREIKQEANKNRVRLFNESKVLLDKSLNKLRFKVETIWDRRENSVSRAVERVKQYGEVDSASRELGSLLERVMKYKNNTRKELKEGKLKVEKLESKVKIMKERISLAKQVVDEGKEEKELLESHISKLESEIKKFLFNKQRSLD